LLSVTGQTSDKKVMSKTSRTPLLERTLRVGEREIPYVELGAYAALAIYFLSTVFSIRPFLNQEILGIAFWWTAEPGNFLYDLFDPLKTDGYPGRFRYVEYLFEAFYWKAMKNGLLPKDLYDYANLTLTALISFLLYRFTAKRDLTRLQRFCVVALLVLSVPAFMTQVYHFRKAKVLVSLLFLLVVMICEWEPEERFNRLKGGLLAALGFIGVLTDPFFILIAPVLAVCHQFARSGNWSECKWLAGGMFAGLGAAALLNGVIGPRYNPRCALAWTSIPNKPPTLISLSNLPYLYDLLPDLFFPNFPTGLTTTLSVALLMGLIGLAIFYRREIIANCPWIGAFLATLVISTFLIRPDSANYRFASYYGYPLILMMALALTDIFSRLSPKSSPQIYRLLPFACAFIVVFHQFSTKPSFQNWRGYRFLTPQAQARYERDDAELTRINAYLSGGATSPYKFEIDNSHLQVFGFTDTYEKNEEGPQRQRSNLAYFLMPMLFHKDIEAGRVKLVRDAPFAYQRP